MLIYIALIFSQVVYSEIYEKTKPKQKQKLKIIIKWADPIKNWVIERAFKIGMVLDQWSINCQGRRRTKRVQAIAYRMQRPITSNNRWKSLVVCAAVAMQASGSSQYDNMAMFDTDSEPIGVDNRCTGCISNKVEDFEGPLIESGRSIKGFGGSRTSNVMIGTIVWRWQDDNGTIHKFTIPKSFYARDGNVRLLSHSIGHKLRRIRNPCKEQETHARNRE